MIGVAPGPAITAVRRTIAAVSLTIVQLLANSASTLAFDGAAAAAYADAHWAECGTAPYNGVPPSPYVCLSNDCANYASRAIHAGGYPFRTSPVTLWANWYWWSAGNNTRTWWQSDALKYFLTDRDPYINGNPGGYVAAVTKGARDTDQYNALSRGDLLFFDWDDNGIIDHVRVEVGWGTPPRTGYQANYNYSYWATGDWADQHTPPRYHDFWNGYYHLTPTERTTVRIYQVHIRPTN